MMSEARTQEDICAIESQGVPDNMPTSTYEAIRRSAVLNPPAPALTFFLRGDRFREASSWSYAKLYRDVIRTANMFFHLGVRRETVIAYILPNLPETHFTIWGGEAAGIVCAINPMLEGSAITDLLNAVQPTVLVTLGPFPGTDLWAKIQPVLGAVPSLQHLVLVNMLDRIVGPERDVARELHEMECTRLFGSNGLRGVVPERIEIHDFGESIARESSVSLKCKEPIRPEDFSSYFCTGGTTSLPKIAMRRHCNEVANAWNAGLVLGDCIGPGKTVFCGLPLFHVNATMVTGLLPFLRGAHVVMGTSAGYRDAGVLNHFWEIVEYHRINFISGVPTIFSSLLNLPIGNCDVSSLEYGICGAAPMPVEVIRQFQQKTGIGILEGYGLTEGTCISSVNPPRGAHKVGSIGLRLPFQDMRVVALDEVGRYVRDCDADEVGVIVIAGSNVFAGYRQTEQNNGAWLDLDNGTRYFNTGDLGRRDEDGYFWLVGRQKELIIRGGHNIDPLLIEEPLHRHPAVQVAAAVGRPDVLVGELPVAYVQLKPGIEATPDELTDFLRREMGERAALPKDIHIIDRMPLTAVGKIFKRELKRWETVDAVRQILFRCGIEATVHAVDESLQGTVLQVDLSDPKLEGRCAEMLGHLPFAYSITPASNG